MKRPLAAVGAGAQRAHVREIPADRLGAPLANPRRSLVRARERSHSMAVGYEPLDQAASDEAGPPGDECSRHPDAA